MRSIFAGIIMLSASMAVVHTAQAEKHGYVQTLIGRQQPSQPSREETIDAGQVHLEEDPLTKRIEQDNARLDRLIRDICPSC